MFCEYCRHNRELCVNRAARFDHIFTHWNENLHCACATCSLHCTDLKRAIPPIALRFPFHFRSTRVGRLFPPTVLGRFLWCRHSLPRIRHIYCTWQHLSLAASLLNRVFDEHDFWFGLVQALPRWAEHNSVLIVAGLCLTSYALRRCKCNAICNNSPVAAVVVAIVVAVVGCNRIW